MIVKKKVVCILSGVLAASMLAGCAGKEAAPAATEATPAATEATAPAAEENEPAQPSAIEVDLSSYEDLILSAPVDYYYAFADLSDTSDALVLAPGDLVFDNGDGSMAATGGRVYCDGPDGSIMEYGYVEGGGTATPLAAGEGHVLFYGGHSDMNKVTIDTLTGEMKVDEGEYFDEYENAVTLAFMSVATYGNSDEEYDGPTDFLQEQCQKTSFADFDEIISYLEPGQGYTMLTLEGSSDEVLVLAEAVNPDDNSAQSASIYAMKDGKPVQAGNVFAGGSAVLRYEDQLIYNGDESTYETDFLNPEGDGLMVRDYVYKDDSEGETTYGGFRRENNEDDGADFTGGEEEFNALIAAREAKAVLEFTPIAAAE